jgi:pimeloyl-ACP methyl ester carboxylesterase
LNILNRTTGSDLRGIMRLAIDATLGVTDVVEKMHHTIQLGHAPLGESRAGNTAGITGLVYRSIRGTTRLIGRGLDAGMTPLIAMLPEAASNSKWDAMVAVINGVYGDHLAATGNPLAVGMGFSCRGKALNPDMPASMPGASGKVLLWVHGLCLNEGNWSRGGTNQGEALANGLGYTPVYLRYNTGLPIPSNGRELAALLEQLLQNWPHPLEELVIAGHSMGGLVARSAVHYGRQAAHGWLKYLRRLVFIGTPHHGAPLERGGNWIDYALDLSPYTAPFTSLGKKRSAGITSLRYGSVADETRDVVPLPAAVRCYAMAATLAKKPSRVHEKLIGDGLVPVDSALGRSRDPELALKIPDDRQWLGYETGHIGLLGHPGVYAQLRGWLAQAD